VKRKACLCLISMKSSISGEVRSTGACVVETMVFPTCMAIS
jgi:hypothetical protein